MEGQGQDQAEHPQLPTTSKGIVILGWFLLATGSIAWVLGEINLAEHTSRGAIAVGQGLLWSLVGLAVLLHWRLASSGLWAIVILSGLGVVARGITPLDILLWLPMLVLALQYGKISSIKPSQMRKADREVLWLLLGSAFVVGIGVPLLIWLIWG